MFYFISVDYELNKGSDIEMSPNDGLPSFGLRYVISIYIRRAALRRQTPGFTESVLLGFFFWVRKAMSHFDVIVY